jgi:hypothetical protein
MALKMLPLYVETNQRDGKNYYLVGEGWWGRKGGGRIFTTCTIEFLENGPTCNTTPVRKRTLSVTLKTHTQH